jgi:hypothetical protein
MHLTDTKVIHEGSALVVEFIGQGGESISVRMAGNGSELDDVEAIGHAKVMMVQLTAFGTRDGGGSLNTYDTLSNGNFDEGEPARPRQPSAPTRVP